MGPVEVAECHGVGPDAAGSVFGNEPRRVAAWRFRGRAPSEVLGVRVDDSTGAVYVAESVPAAPREWILEQLRRPETGSSTRP